MGNKQAGTTEGWVVVEDESQATNERQASSLALCDGALDSEEQQGGRPRDTNNGYSCRSTTHHAIIKVCGGR